MADTSYAFASWCIESEFPLPELSPIEGPDDRPRLRVRLRDEEPPAIEAWGHQWIVDGEPTLSHARQGDDHILEFGEGIRFRVSKAERVVDCHYAWGDADSDLRHALLDQVLPRVLNGFGETVLHASAVDLDGSGLLFLGDSGWGKSTLAGRLHQRSHRLLSDDCVVLELDAEGPRCISTYEGLRLRPESMDHLYSDKPVHSEPMAEGHPKQRLTWSGGMAPRSLPVAAIVVLAPPEPQLAGQATLHRLRSQRTTMLLIEHSFRLDVNAKADSASAFEAAVRASAGIPTFELQYPREYALLDGVLDQVTEVVRSEGRGFAAAEAEQG